MNAAAGTSAQAATLDGCEDCLDHAREAAAEHMADNPRQYPADLEAVAGQYVALGLTAPCAAHTV
jgi:hypothetical protein